MNIFWIAVAVWATIMLTTIAGSLGQIADALAGDEPEDGD